MEIVPFVPSQYEALARVLMAAYGNYRFDAENLRFRDEILSSAYVSKRWTGVFEGMCVGFGEYSQTPEMHNPGIFLLNIAVHPEYQNRGAGTSLYNRIISDVKAHRPTILRSACRADHDGSASFLRHRGFAQGMSIAELYLDLDSADAELSIPKPKPDNGIEIKTMQSLESDPNRNRKLYDLVMAIRSDIPTPQPITPVTFNKFVTGFVSSPSRLPEATFVAVDDNTNEYVGISDLFNDGNNGLLAGLTGVRREYRKRGIASALKQIGFRYAGSHGFNSITTFNAAENAAIAAVNKRLGFTEKFTWLHFEKQVSNG